MKKIFCLLAAVMMLFVTAVPAFAADVEPVAAVGDDYAVMATGVIEYPSWKFLKSIVAQLPSSVGDVEFDSFFLCLADAGTYGDGTFKINCILWDADKTNFYWKRGDKYDWDNGAYLYECFWSKDDSPPSWKQYTSVDQTAGSSKLLYSSRDIYDQAGTTLITSAGIGPSYKAFLYENDGDYAPGDVLNGPSGSIAFEDGLDNFWSILGSIITALPEDVFLTISWLFAAFLIVGGIKLFN